jgi:peroxiredoxin
MPYLQKLSSQYKELAILAINDSDDQALTSEFLREHGIKFPTVLDTSGAAAKVFKEYGGGALPMNYLIDGDGKVVEAWFSLLEPEKMSEALEKAGLRFSEVRP